MRTLALIGMLAVAAVAFALPPDKVSEVDSLKLQLMQVQQRAAMLEAELARCQFRERYQLGEGDSVDEKLNIKRVVKAPVKK